MRTQGRQGGFDAERAGSQRTTRADSTDILCFFASEFGREPSKLFGINASLPWSVLVTCPYAEQVRRNRRRQPIFTF